MSAVTKILMQRGLGEPNVTDVYLRDGTHIKPDNYSGNIVVDVTYAADLEQGGWVRSPVPYTQQLTLLSSVYRAGVVSGIFVSGATGLAGVGGVPVAVAFDGSSTPSTVLTTPDGFWLVSTSSLAAGAHVALISIGGTQFGSLSFTK